MALVARSLMYSSVRQATSDLTSAVLGADAGSVVAEGLDTIVAAQATLSSVTCTGVGWLLQASSSASLANNLLYVGIKRGSTEAVVRHFGPALGAVTVEGLDSLSMHGLSTHGLSQLPLSSVSSVGWALSGCHVADQRRILSTTVSHRHEPPIIGNSPPIIGNSPSILGNSPAEPNQTASPAAAAASPAAAAPAAAAAAAPAAAEAKAAATAEEEEDEKDEWILLGSH